MGDGTLCQWKSGVGGEPIQQCDACHHEIPLGGEVHFISDGGYEPRDGSYVGLCCIRKFTSTKEPSA